jgi:DNA-binding transcriptional MerR regulator
MNAERTYGTAAFAALAGVTPRALRHYDRLGLLRPTRSSTGYRRYRERDLETLEEIVALKFIGLPLKQIAAIRRRPERPFAQVLRAQREALEVRRRVLTRAVEAIAAAEVRLGSTEGRSADAIRRIIEVMHVEQNQERLIDTYTTALKTMASRLAAMSTGERATLRQEWAALVEDVRAALGEDPRRPRAQSLLDRWLSLQQAIAGGRETAAAVSATELRAELWARRADWLPPDAARTAEDLSDASEALAHVRALAASFAGDDVLAFIGRAKAARE